MRRLLYIALTAAALASAPALAQEEHAAHHPAPDAKASAPAAKPPAEQPGDMSKMCMDAAAKDKAAHKHGHHAKMDPAMHEHCMAMMKDHGAMPAKPAEK